MVDPTQTVWRLRHLFHMLQSFQMALARYAQPIFVYGDTVVETTAAQRGKIKGAIRTILADITKEAARAGAIGGVAQDSEIEQMQGNPETITSIMGEALREAGNIEEGIRGVIAPDGSIAADLDPGNEEELKDWSMTAGVCLDMWLTWMRPQVEALP